MKEKVTRTHIAALLLILLVTSTLQIVSIYDRNLFTGLAGSQVGTVGMCFESNPRIEPIPNFTKQCGDIFYYEVNTTTFCHHEYPKIFSDSTPIFNINSSTGIINTTLNGSAIGLNQIFIYVFENQWNSQEDFYLNVTDVLQIQPIPNFVINVTDTFYYQAKTIQGCQTGTFTDNTNLFNIDPVTGIINFTSQEGDEGSYLIYIYVTNGPVLDSEPFWLTIQAISTGRPDLSVSLAPDNEDTILNWTNVTNSDYYEIYYTDNP